MAVLGCLRALILDDDELTRTHLKRLLARHLALGEAAILTAADPDGALAAVRDLGCPPEFVLSDFDLHARMNGLEFLQAVAEACPGTARILMSGHPRERLRIPGDAPIDGFVEKTLRMEEMVEALRVILDRAR